MDTIQLSTAQKDALTASALTASSPTPAVSAKNPQSSPRKTIVTVAGHKVTTHTLAVGLGLMLAAIGPAVVKAWPETAPAIDASKQVLPKPDPAPPPAAVQISTYEIGVRAAWAAEKDAATGLKKIEKLARLIFLYRRGAFEAEHKWGDLAELYRSFHDEADKIDMAGQLAILRGTITAEWSARIPEKAPLRITETMRARMSSFIRETIAILQRLQ